jgi:hypothetical protein
VKPHALPDAADAPPGLADHCVQAVTTAAWDLGLDPELFAEELAQGEIGLLIRYLGQAANEVRDPALRTHIAELLHRLTAWTGPLEPS